MARLLPFTTISPLLAVCWVMTTLKDGCCLRVSLSFTTEVEEKKQFMLTLVKVRRADPLNPHLRKNWVSFYYLISLLNYFEDGEGVGGNEVMLKHCKLGIQLPERSRIPGCPIKDAFQWVPTDSGCLGSDGCLSLFLPGSMYAFSESQSSHKLINKQKNDNLKSVQGDWRGEG